MQDQENITAIDNYVRDFVKRLRKSRKLSQEDLGNIIGVSRSYIRDIENNRNRAKYNIRHINALADYFDISPREFLPEKAFPVDVVEKEKEKKVVKKATVKKATKKKS